MRRITIVDRVERASALDRCVRPLKRAASRIRGDRVRDTLNGVWLGHPAHPMLVQVPIGAWISAGVLDAFPRHDQVARRLIQVGLVAALPAVVTGTADWSQQNERQSRVGLVHSLVNATAVALYSASLVARSKRSPIRGRLLAYSGLAAVGVGGFLGGHIAYRQAGGVNRAEGVRRVLPGEWRSIGALADLPERTLVRRTVEGCDLVVTRRGHSVHALVDTCSHQAGALSDGTLLHEDTNWPSSNGSCVRCPLHGSVFRLADGEVVHGPATAPQPVLLTRVRDGIVQVRPQD